jgi:hypothetical protein
MVHASWVHVAVSTVNESCALHATRHVPRLVRAVAADPVVLSGEAGSMVMDSVRPETDAETDASAGTLSDGDVGDVGVPPPQPASAPAARSDATWHACAQNSLRVVESFASMEYFTRSPPKWMKVSSSARIVAVLLSSFDGVGVAELGAY